MRRTIIYTDLWCKIDSDIRFSIKPTRFYAKPQRLTRLRCWPRASAPRTWCCSISSPSTSVPIGIFTLDTGRLPQETYDLLQMARARYQLPIAVFAPESGDIERYIAANGPNGFYDSVALRQECCHLRKVKPLQRALTGKEVLGHGVAAQPIGRARVASRRRNGMRTTSCENSIRLSIGRSRMSGILSPRS